MPTLGTPSDTMGIYFVITRHVIHDFPVFVNFNPMDENKPIDPEPLTNDPHRFENNANNVWMTNILYIW